MAAIGPAGGLDGRQTGENIGQPGLWVGAVHLGCDDETVHT
jgi:hypothetical protein